VVRGCGNATREVDLFGINEELPPYGISLALGALTKSIRTPDDARLLRKVGNILGLRGDLIASKTMTEAAHDVLLRSLARTP
jgi:hypothetical protein